MKNITRKKAKQQLDINSAVIEMDYRIDKTALQEALINTDKTEFIKTEWFEDVEVFTDIIKSYVLVLGRNVTLEYESFEMSPYNECHMYTGSLVTQEINHQFRFIVHYKAGKGFKMETNFTNEILIKILERDIGNIGSFRPYQNYYSNSGDVLLSHKGSKYDWIMHDTFVEHAWIDEGGFDYGEELLGDIVYCEYGLNHDFKIPFHVYEDEHQDLPF